MKIVRTSYFEAQIVRYTKLFTKTEKDINSFFENIDRIQWQFLGGGLYKFRIKNSSIPTGKRDGYRIIVYINHTENTILPIVIYAKSHISNLTKDDISTHFEKTLQALQQ